MLYLKINNNSDWSALPRHQLYMIQLAFLTPCDQAFNPPFLGGKIIELGKFCFKNKGFEPSL